MNGLIKVDKPRGCTSHDVVNRWRRLAHTKRAGHLGTLDPMATGLLLLVTGTATRLARFFEKQTKTYDAEITFGLTSDTYDAEGTLCETGAPLPSESDVNTALDRFRGKFLQVPPAVSAKKVGGVASYKLARQDKAVELAPVEVEVTSLSVITWQPPKLHLMITCSAGTYIRSIAHDLGAKLECGAILSALRRLACGNVNVSEAYTLDDLEQLAREDRLQEAIIPAAELLPEFPAAYVDLGTETHIRQGRDFRTSPFTVPAGAPLVKALSEAGDLIAIGELRFPNVYHPMLVL